MTTKMWGPNLGPYVMTYNPHDKDYRFSARHRRRPTALGYRLEEHEWMFSTPWFGVMLHIQPGSYALSASARDRGILAGWMSPPPPRWMHPLVRFLGPL